MNEPEYGTIKMILIPLVPMLAVIAALSGIGAWAVVAQVLLAGASALLGYLMRPPKERNPKA